MKKTLPFLAAISAMLCAGCSEGRGNGDTAGAIGPAYCVIDLGGGPEAKSYPVAILDELPADFGSSVYKTGKVILKWIEPGSFAMGQILEATPIREVTLSRGFYMGVYEITQAQWEKVMGPVSFHFGGKATHPAEMISWEEIRGDDGAHDWPAARTVSPESFMGRLAARTGGAFGFDLPTEAQWEFACRAGTDTWWSFGKDRAVADEYAWSTDNSGDTTQEVGTKKPNAWGLFDLHGNVWEWCLDRFGPYDSAVLTDPTGAVTGWHRVWRGGGWDASVDLHRSAHRNGGTPSSRAFHVGFRLVMSPK